MVAFFIRASTITKPLADFVVFWTAARAPLDHVYDAAALTDLQRWYVPTLSVPRPFPYPPSALPWFEAFGALPMVWAGVAWGALTLAAFATASRLIVPLAGVGLALVSRPVLETLFAGQVSLLVGALLVCGVALLKTRPLAAGVLIGLCATLKPQAVLLAPLVLVAGGYWRTLAAAVVSGALVGLVCLAVQGLAVWSAWLSSLTGFVGALQLGDIVRLGITPNAWGIWPITLAGGLLGLLVAWRCARSPPDIVLAGLVTGSLLCSPYALYYDLSLLTPAAAMMVLDRDAHPAVWIIAAVALTGLTGPVGVIALAGLLLWSTWRERQTSGAQAIGATAQ